MDRDWARARRDAFGRFAMAMRAGSVGRGGGRSG